MAKTPDYTRRAIATYDAKVTKKQIVLNPDKPDEAQLIEAINADDISFSKRVKEMLKEFYNIA